jgi:hypothetical protein
MTDKYSAMLTLQHDAMNVLDQTMPITVIREWEVSIRPCEFDNFARLFDILTDIRISFPEYVYLMRGLTAGSGSLLDLIDMPDDEYKATRAEGTSLVKTPQIFAALDQARASRGCGKEGGDDERAVNHRGPGRHLGELGHRQPARPIGGEPALCQSADRAERCSAMVVPYRNGRSRARRERSDSGLSYRRWINHPQYGSSG